MAKVSRSKPSAATSAKRREEIRRTLPRPTFNIKAVLQKPEVMNATLILASFLLLVSMVVVWTREQVKVRDGQVMTETRLKRIDYQVEDEEQTRIKRDEAAKSSPRVYRLNESYLSRLEASLLGLPKAVAGKTSLDEISFELRNEFNLTAQTLRALQEAAVNGEPTPEWTRWVRRLVHEQLMRSPLIRSAEYQRFATTLNKGLLLPSGELQQPIRADAIEMRSETGAPPESRLEELAVRASFPPQLVPVAVARLLWDPQPTLLYVEDETTRRARLAAEAIEPVMVQHQRGEILYRRGDVLSSEQYAEVRTETAKYHELASRTERWQPRLGLIGLVAVITLFLGSFTMIAYPRIVRNPLRLGALCLLMGIMLATSSLVTAYAPIFLYPAAIGPTLFVAIIVLVAYDQRLALLLSGIQCMLVALALEQGIGFFILLMAGCGAMIAQLREVRHRNSLIRAATGTAAVLGAGTILLGLYEVPGVPGAFRDILTLAVAAISTSYGVSFLVLGILPSIERLFDITTGMTLAELRDPKRPLLRQLQQRAPGTYNHSLQVANIAEAAAEAIGADSLLVYVGALYHDIGKINKPEYFVENQAGGLNKHDKLSPAMSLLVIIGHVKNGVELAREYGLPRQLQHFIESHHGTTLVEYFYHAAKVKAESTAQGEVRDVEYRYPGPKPRTKEAAILMLADAVESATRAMAEPNPSRIENLVRKLSAKRLQDGQFDQCELTFRELALIEDAIISRVLAIYHGRISYPTASRPSEPPTESVPRAAQIKPASA